MTDVALDFGGAGANSIYPKRVSALYRGGEITVLGRFKGTGPGDVTLTGNVAGEPRSIPLKVTWPARDLDNSYLPRVWAMRKIGHLIEDVRLHGQNQEMIKEIVDLSQRHGIVTPYTSQLVLEPGMENRNWNLRPPPVAGSRRGIEDDRTMLMKPMAPADAMARQREVFEKGKDSVRAASQAGERADGGETANALSSEVRRLKEADANQPAAAPEVVTASEAPAKAKRLEDLRKVGEALAVDKEVSTKFGRPPGGLGDGAGRGDNAVQLALAVEQAKAQAIKQVGTRTFYNRGGVWVDSTAKPNAKPTVVKTFSKEYFELLKGDPSLGAVLALGGNILVMVKETLYQIEEQPKE
ncbi:MAG: hypothetical protein ABSE73_25935 [Planctomycetota bacterium]